MTDNTLLSDISKATLAMREDEKQHFSALVRILIRCYTEKDQKMAIFMSSDELESATLATKPHKDYLSPEGAKLIEKAYRRSLQKKESELAIEDLLD